jgi:FtsP/CotA-like multicopper oxidase with cupredoxin domain
MTRVSFIAFWVVASLVSTVAHASTNDLPGAMEYTSENGVLEVLLNVSQILSLDGTRRSPVYNGYPVGPTLRVKPGDTVMVQFNNMLSPGSDLDRELYAYLMNPESDFVNTTIISNRLDDIGNVGNPKYGFWGRSYMNIHFHGAEFSPTDENVMVAYDGGESHTYAFKVNENKSGLVWYHNHFHGAATPSMLSGLYGFMVIEGPNDVAQAPELQDAKEQFLMLGESLTNPETLEPVPDFPFALGFDWQHVTNGEIGTNKTFEYNQGDLVLFRAASASVEPTMNMTLKNHTFTIVARDGYPLAKPETVENLIIGAGQRVDFLVKFDKPGRYVWRRMPWNVGITGVEMCTMFVGMPREHCLSYDVRKFVGAVLVMPTGTPSTTEIPTQLSLTMPDYLQERMNRPVLQNRTVTMRMKTTFPLFQIPYDGPFVPPGFAMGMDDFLYAPHHTHGMVQAGSCETWTIVMDPYVLMEHVFHTHSVPFLVTQHNGVDVETPYWTDTLLMDQSISNATAHICFDGLLPGETMMYHCHMPTHQDIGVRTDRGN